MKLVFEITKTGSMIYISHLDLSRLFLRVLRMSGLRPVYSQGYNPHPKMSFALPLSVGLYSVCELLEFETDEKWSEDVTDQVNNRLPEGIHVTNWHKKPESVTKSLASFVDSAAYEFMCEGVYDAPELLKAFFSRGSVNVLKFDKRAGEKTEKDIRSEMLDFRIIKDMRGRMLAEATLLARPGHTLNPVTFFGAFCEASGLNEADMAPVITRTAILCADGKPLKEMLK